MALRITRRSDPIVVEQLVVALFGQPGIGKSTCGFTAAEPLLLDFDRGAHRAANRQDILSPSSWADVTGIEPDSVRDYKTIVVDTVGRALDMLSRAIIDENYKWGNCGNLTLQGYGVLKARFSGWLAHVRSLGLDVVLIAHSEEQKRGDATVERLDAQGSSKNEIHKSSDAMGRLFIEGGKRMLDFSPTGSSYGKNPGQLPVLPIPHYEEDPAFLADVIAKIKTKLNQMTEEQRQTAAVLEEWRTKLSAAAQPEDFDLLLAEASAADPKMIDNIKRLIWKATIEKNIKFDKQSGVFVPNQT